jgi:hypothetical protein
MLPVPGPVSLRLEKPSGVTLRPGGVVGIQVLRRLPDGRWAVRIQGRVVAVSAEVELAAGSRLLARVFSAAGRVTLRVLDTAASAAGAGRTAAGGADQVVAAFAAAGLKAGQEAVEQVRRLLERLRLPPQRFARLAVLLREKGIELTSPGIGALLGLLAYGETGGRNRRRPQSRPAPAEEAAAGAAAEEAAVEKAAVEQVTAQKGAEELKREMEKPGEESILALFNHLQPGGSGGADGPGGEQWIIVPYRYAGWGGTIRLRRRGEDVDRMVLSAGEGGPWRFVLSRRRPGAGLQLCAFSRDAPVAPPARAAWRKLAHKLHNLGVETDDTIRGEEGFDGFSLPWETGGFRGIDTEG